MECRPSPVSPTVRALPLRGPETQRRSPVQPPWRSSAKAPALLRTSAGGREACNPRGVPAPRARGRWDGWAGRDARGSKLGAGRRGAATLGSRAALTPSGGGGGRKSPAPTSSSVAGRREMGPRLENLSDHIPSPTGARAAGRPAIGTGRWEEEVEEASRFLTWVCLIITGGACLRGKKIPRSDRRGKLQAFLTLGVESLQSYMQFKLPEETNDWDLEKETSRCHWRKTSWQTKKGNVYLGK